MRTIDIFKEIITGDFDNSKQVADEVAAGKQIHPLARHVNRVANEKIKHLPKDDSSFFILEESYYEYPGRPTELKPFLFKFSAAEKNRVQLSVFQLPSGMDKVLIRNDNSALFFDYGSLILSPSFSGASYSYNQEEGSFSTCSSHGLGNGMKFTLTETFSREKLIVMELLEQDGKRLTPYDTPIVYDRKN
jgi:ribosomal protein S17E